MLHKGLINRILQTKWKRKLLPFRRNDEIPYLHKKHGKAKSRMLNKKLTEAPQHNESKAFAKTKRNGFHPTCHEELNTAKRPPKGKRTL